jgi:hypothetical protein
MSQDTGSNPNDIPRQTATAWSLDIESCHQSAKNGLNTVSDVAQSAANLIRPLLGLIVTAQRQQPDPALFPKAVLQLLIIVGFVANQYQISTIEHQSIQNIQVMNGSRSQQPFINHLLRGHGGMKAQAKELALLAGYDPKVIAANHTPAPLTASVGHQGNRRTIDQPNRITLIDFLVSQITADGFNRRYQLPPPLIKPIQINQVGKHI